MGKKFRVKVNGEVFDVEVEEVGATKEVVSNSVSPKLSPAGESVSSSAPTVAVEKAEPVLKEAKKQINTTGKKVVSAPLPGKVLSVKAKKGDPVKKGNLLLILEAMKMENEIYASQDGVITDVLVSAGDYVSTGDKLIVME